MSHHSDKPLELFLYGLLQLVGYGEHRIGLRNNSHYICFVRHDKCYILLEVNDNNNCGRGNDCKRDKHNHYCTNKLDGKSSLHLCNSYIGEHSVRRTNRCYGVPNNLHKVSVRPAY